MSVEDGKRQLLQGTDVLAVDPPYVRSQQLARVAFDSTAQFVGLLDAAGTVLEINRQALDLAGIDLSAVQGKPLWTTFWWQVSEEARTTLIESLRRASSGEFVRWDTEIQVRASDILAIDATLRPVTDDRGAVVFVCIEGRDVTERKAQERQSAQKDLENQTLLQRVHELEEIQTQFFANVSHELRTPLALILGPAQRLIDDAGTMDWKQRRESAEVVVRNARTLLKHVNDLLDVSKLEARKTPLVLEDTDVAALMRLVAAHFAALAAERGIEFVVDADSQCYGAVDPEKLQRVLVNLLGNAFNYVPGKGRIRCGLKCSDRAMTVTVDDSGSGVKPELRRGIFERFRRADGGMERKAGGIGLGLAIAKEFVELHQGRIELSDSDLGGARFEVTIPFNRGADAAGAPPSEVRLDRVLIDGVIAELRPSRPEPRAERTTPVTSRPRVLVVEDNVDLNRFVIQCLEDDYEVITAFDGREGLAKAHRFRPTLVVSDIMMPTMSGVQMIAGMRRLPELQATPILLLSAKADEQLMVKLLDEGAQDFIVKPFSEKELLVRVRNLTAQVLAREELNGLRVAAESANRAKDEFLAMLGHELRNPLSPILTALHLMKLRGEAGSERERTVIERQVNHLTRLVDDLLDVSRIARGKVELKVEILEVGDIVGKAIEMASPLLEQRSHNLFVDVPKQGLRIEGDPTRLAQVVSNVLTNAAKYTPPGGNIAIQASRAGGEIVLTVHDTGIGIAPDVLPRVFDLFVQERQALDRSQGGLGIGLAIVRNLIERHGGSVAARSDGPGHGSEFEIRLPAVTSEQEQDAVGAGARKTPSAILSPLRAARILVVDDNEDGAEMLAEALGERGYDTRVAHDAPTALRLAAEFLPQVAFLDIGLPVMDGYELATHLRKIPGLANLQLIAVTGYGQESDRRRTREAGFQHHFVKPIDLAAIEAALRAHLLPRRRDTLPGDDVS
jgi:PAS domain S-box-containing protein